MVVFSAISAILSSALAALILYERYYLQGFLDNFTLLLVGSLSAIAAFSLFSTYAMGMRHAQRIERIWIVALSVALSYGAADVLAGLLLIPPLSPALVGDATVHHRLVANSNSALASRDFSYIQRVNNLGLRGGDIAPQKSANTFRIAMLGDSFTMGKGVEDGETFSALLEVSLNSGPHRRIEVLNAGVDSYAPILSYMQLKTQLLPLAPDLVMLHLDMSDLLQEIAYHQRATYDAEGQLVGVDGRWDHLDLTRTQRMRNWINEHLFFSRLLFYYAQRMAHQSAGINVANVVGMANPAVLAHTLAGYDEARRQSEWERLFASVRAIQALCAERGIDFVLTAYPWGHQVGSDEWQPGRFAFIGEESIPSDASLDAIRSLARADNMPFIDLFVPLRAYRGSAKLYHRYDMHWTPAGHRVVADALRQYLTTHYALFSPETQSP